MNSPRRPVIEQQPSNHKTTQQCRKPVVLAFAAGIVIFNLCLFQGTHYISGSPHVEDGRTLKSKTNVSGISSSRSIPIQVELGKRKEPTKITVTGQDELWKRRLQESSIAAVQGMKDRGAFRSPFSGWESAVANGFPVVWTPCSLQQLLQQKQNQTLRVMILGGSCSARAANNCTDETGNPLSGRYSNIVQRAMDQDHSSHATVKVDFVNLALGNINSMLNGMIMDTYVDPTQADILIWEFSPNENWGFGRNDPTKLQFWLARVQSLFQRVNKPMPPILFVFLWERNIGWGRRIGEILQRGMGTPGASALSTLQYYRQQGWNFQAISVGSIVANLTAVAANPKLLLDDEIHPGCHAVHLIADMIQHAIHTNLATCGDTDSVTHHDPYNKTAVAPEQPPLLDIQGVSDLESLWGLMVNPHARIASFTPWPPQPGGLSNLHLDQNNMPRDWKLIDTENTCPCRADRKLGYTLTRCNANDTDASGLVNVTLLEPTLEWLGIGVNKKENLGAFLNGLRVNTKEDLLFESKLGIPYVHTWINLTDHRYDESGRRRNSYILSLCDTSQGGKTQTLRQLVGVMQPTNGTQDVAIVQQ